MEKEKSRNAAWKSANRERLKASRAVYRAANREKENAYRIANKERVKARQSAWGAANRNKVKASQSAYRAANKSKVKAMIAAWGDANPEKVRARKVAWAAANPKKVRAIAANSRHRRRAQELNSPHPAATAEIRAMFAKAKRCLYCDAPFTKARPRTLDHIAPLSRGGHHSLDNFAVCCRSCNSRKRAAPPEDWAARIGMLMIA